MKQKNSYPVFEKLSLKAQNIYKKLTSYFGYVPNLYLNFSHSSNAWEGYMALQENNGNDSFTMLERDAIQIVVSGANKSEQCLAVHSKFALEMGYTLEEVKLLQSGRHTDSKLNSLVLLAKEIVKRKGKATKEAKKDFYAQGFTNQHLVDLVMMIADKTIMNYLENLLPTEKQYPQI
jgi:AhpD family alkylhydroperoxidase